MKHSLPEMWKEEKNEQTMTKQMPCLKPLTTKEEELQQRNYRIQPNYRTYPYKRTVKQFWGLQIVACVLLSPL